VPFPAAPAPICRFCYKNNNQFKTRPRLASRFPIQEKTIPEEGFMRVSRLMTMVGLSFMVACESGALLTDPDGMSLSSVGGKQEAKGQGVFLFDFGGTIIPTSFDFKAKLKADGSVSGDFRQTLTVNGFLLDVLGDVTCVTFDHDNGRAWIGAVVTENNSEAFFTGEVHQPGRDVWFRVNMRSQESFNPAADFVDVRGSFNGWSAGTDLMREGTSFFYSGHGGRIPRDGPQASDPDALDHLCPDHRTGSRVLRRNGSSDRSRSVAAPDR